MAAETTPMLQQYRELKARYPDCLLLFRLGDFYELFFEDAEKGARALGLTLTSRPSGRDGRIPMCGLPFHAAEGYVARLVRQGFRVAICDQVEDPAKAKGLVKRDVTRVVSPGTVLEPGQLDARANNYLACVDRDGDRIGLSSADLTTGEWTVGEWRAPEGLFELSAELARLSAAEILVTPSAHRDTALSALVVEAARGAPVRELPGSDRAAARARERLQEHLGVATLAGFGCDAMASGLRAADALLAFLAETQRGALAHFRDLKTLHGRGGLIVDASAQRHLELVANQRDGGRDGTLLAVLDETRTPMGARMLRRWILRPLADPEAIRLRLSAVAECVDDAARRRDLGAALAPILDIERVAGRLGTGVAHPRDLLGLRQSLLALPAVQAVSVGVASSLLAELTEGLDPMADVADEIGRTLREDAPAVWRDGGIIRSGVDAKLDEIRGSGIAGKDEISAIQARERARTGIESLKVQYNQVFGYFIEVTRTNASRVPADYERRQTMANAERFVTPELKALETKILSADRESGEIESRLFVALRDACTAAIPRLRDAVERISQIDVLRSLAEAAVRRGYVRPEVDAGEAIEIRSGRHPVVETLLPSRSFVANDALLDSARDHLLIVLTGPNMAGKSTYMRQVALITILAQIGSFVPAESARIGVADRIFTRVGASDSIATGRSTFMVEMTEASEILRHATARSLVLLDEIGRGTSTFDGISIAWGVAEHIVRRVGCRTLFATHYYELTELALTEEKVKNYNVVVKEWQEQVIFLRRIEPGSADRSYGIQVARLAGLPAEVLARARQILSNLEKLNFSPGGRSRLAEAREQAQMSLFEAPAADPHVEAVLEEIRASEPDRMTPLDALLRLREWKRSLAGEGEV